LSNLLFEEETYKIRKACFNVYNKMGCGFLEAVYQECLVFNYLKATGLKVGILVNFGSYPNVTFERICY